MTKINLQQMFAAKMDDLESLFHEFDGDRKDEFITKYPDIWDEVYDIMEESRYHRAMKSILKAGYTAALNDVEGKIAGLVKTLEAIPSCEGISIDDVPKASVVARKALAEFTDGGKDE
jgi:hypothetical protein